MEGIQIKVGASANFGPLKAQIDRLTASGRALNAVFSDQVRLAGSGKNGSPEKMVEKYRAWQQQIDDNRHSLISLTQAQGEMEVTSMKVARATDTLADKLQKNKHSLRDLYRGGREELDALYRRQQALSQSVGMTRGFTPAGSAMVDVFTPRQATELGRRIDEVRQKTAFYGEVVNSVSKSSLNWGKNTQWAGRQLMAGLTYPMVLAAAGTVKYAYDMDKALTQIVKVYGDSGTAMKETDESIRASAEKTAKFLATTYGQSFEDSLEIQSQLASTGKTGNELQRATIAVSEARLLGELNIQDAMSATINLQETYGLQAEALGEKFAYMNTMENETSLTMQDFVVGIPKVSGIMNTLGGTLEDTGTLFAAMKSAGIDAKEGGNAIKSIVFKDLAPSQQALKLFNEKTGQSLITLRDQTQGQVIPMLLAVGEAMDGLGNPERVEIMSKVFGIHQGSKAMGLIAALQKGVNDPTSQVAEAMRIAKMSPEENLEIASGELRTIANADWTKAQRGIQAIKIALAELGEQILAAAGPALQKLGGFISKLAEGFNKMPDWAQNAIILGTGITAVVGPLIMLAGLFTNLASQAGIAGGAIAKMADKTFSIYTTKQNAMRLAVERTTAAMRGQTAAAGVLASAEQNNLATMDFMIDNGGTQRGANGKFISAENQKKRYRGDAGYEPTPSGLIVPKAAVENAASIANNSDKARRSWGRIQDHTGALAGTLGTIGMITTESGGLANNISNALFFGSLLGPTIMKGLKPVLDSSMKLMKTYGATMRVKAAGNVIGMGAMLSQTMLGKAASSAAGKVGLGRGMGKMSDTLTQMPAKATNAFKTLGLSIARMAGPIGIATVAGLGLFYMIKKRAKEARAAQDALNKSTEDYAKVLNISLGTEKDYKIGSEKNKTSSYVDLAKQATDANDNLKRGLEDFRKEVERMESDVDKKEAIRNYGIQKGMEARIKGATAEQAKEIARVAAVSVNGEFAESMVVDITVKPFISLDDSIKGQIDSVRRGIKDAVESQDTVYEVSHNIVDEDYKTTAGDMNGVGMNYRNFELTEEAKTKMAEDVTKTWDAFKDLEGSQMQKAFQKISTDTYAGMEDFWDTLTDEQKNMLRNKKGVADGQGLALLAEKLGGTKQLEQYMISEGQDFTDTQDALLKKNLLVIENLIQQYAGKLEMSQEDIDKLKGTFDINALLESDGMQARGVKAAVASLDQIREAQRKYIADMDAAKAAGREWSLPKKEFEAEIRGQELGLNRITNLTDDWTSQLLMNRDALDKNSNAIKYNNATKEENAKNPYYMNGEVDSEGFQRGGVMKIDASKVDSKQFVAAYRSGMVSMQKEITDFASNAMDESHESIISGLEKDAEQAMDLLDKQGQDAADKFEKDSEALEARYDRKQEDFDARWERKNEKFDKKWENRMETFSKEASKAREDMESLYDARINKIDRAIKAEQDAEAIRQRIFEKEKARIAHYASLANTSIDINMAISSGNLDEAAKLSNDAQASIETFEMGDAAEDSQSGSDALIASLEKNKEAENKKKEVALKALEERQEADRKRLEDEQKNARKSLDIQKAKEGKALQSQRDFDKKALQSERDRGQKALEASKKSTRDSLEDKKDREEQKYKAAKKALDQEIDAVLAAAPRSKKELQANMDALMKAYGDYGGGLEKKGDEWAFIVRDRLGAHMRKARREMMDDVGWEQMGNRIASRMAKGSFGMSLNKFLDWVGLGAIQQNKSGASAAKSGSDAARPEGSRSLKGGVTRHTGGIIDSSRGSRAGYSGRNQAQSEVWVNALKGESVLNRNATAKLGKKGVDDLNSGKSNIQYGDGPGSAGAGFGGLAGLMMAGFMKPVIEKAIVKQGAVQQAKDSAAQVAGIVGDSGGGATSRFDAFWKALSNQESGGNYGAVNKLTGALGRYQVLPSNVGPWSRAALGKTISTGTFLNTPKYQDAIMKHVLGGYYKKWGARGAAAAWYAGPGNHHLHMSTRPQPGGPSIKGYVDNIVKMMNNILAKSAVDTGGSVSGAKVYAGMGWRKMWDIIHAKYPNRSYPANNQTTGGGHKSTSYHYKGRALDLGSMGDKVPLMTLFNWIKKNFGSKSAELIYTPAGNRQVKNGREMYYADSGIRQSHYNHVHWAMQNGGLVPGRGFGDRTPIMGEPGEFMMKKKAVENLGVDSLKLLNSDRFINMPKNASTFRPSDSSPSVVDAGNTFQYNITVDASGNADPDAVKRAVAEAITEANRRSGHNRKVGS